MPNYSTSEIQTLLDAAAYKAGVELNNHGFQLLSEAIMQDGDPYQVRMTPRYLKESIWLKTQKARENNKAEIGLSEDRVDTLALYLGFPHYKAFHKEYQDWSAEVDKEVFNKRADKANDLCIIAHPKDEEIFGKRFKKTLDYSGLKYAWLYPDQDKAIKALEEAVYGIWLLSETWTQEEISYLLAHDKSLSEEAKNILLLKLGELPTEVEDELAANPNKLKSGGNSQLGIIISMFKSLLEQSEDKEKGGNSHNEFKTEYKKIKKFKGVILKEGGFIKAKYFAGGDMHIKIKHEA